MADILASVTKILSDLGLDDKKIVYIENQLRKQYAGSYVYITKKPSDFDAKIMNHIRRSRNFQAISKEFQVSINTVYRFARKVRAEK